MSKEGFILYTGMYDSIREFLTLEQKGMLLDAIHDYQESGIEPSKQSPIAMPFAIYKNQFRLDSAKHEKRAEKARQNGQKGGRPKKSEENPENPVGFSETQQNPEKPNESYKEKEKVKDKEKDKEKELSNESIGAGAAKIEDIENFSRHTEAWITAFGTAGNRWKTEDAYKSAVLRLKANGMTEKAAHKHLLDQAAKDRAFCLRIKRRRRDPDKWLNEGDWSKDYDQELKNHKEIEDQKVTTAKGGLNNGKSAQQEYADAARQHARDSGL